MDIVGGALLEFFFLPRRILGLLVSLPQQKVNNCRSGGNDGQKHVVDNSLKDCT